MKSRTQASRKTRAQTTAPAALSAAPPAHDEAPAPELTAQLGAGQGHSFAGLAVTAAPAGAIQPRLTVGAAPDRYEDEADRVAGQVTQRRAAPTNNTGLPDGLKIGVERLSGHSLDDVRVHYNSPRPARLQASAYAQGSAIYVGPGQEQHLPHEAWHVAQQKQGRVSPTMQLKGVQINDNDGMEREADLKGQEAATTNQGNIAQESQLQGKSTPSTSVVVQRSVDSFEADTTELVPPAQDLISELENNPHIEEQYDGEIGDRVRGAFASKGVKKIPAPDKITATLNADANDAPPRKSYYTGAIGNIGRDQFFLKTTINEIFEGGHIIPHSLWDKNDDDVDNADHYNNLVPMSRTLNVENWAERENWMRGKIQALKPQEDLKLVIDITREDFLYIPVGNLARFFQLTLKKGANPDERVELYNWLPRKLKLSYERINRKKAMVESENEFSSDVEELQNTFEPINTKDELIEALQASQFRHRISDVLWTKLQKMK